MWNIDRINCGINKTLFGEMQQNKNKGACNNYSYQTVMLKEK